MPAIRVELTLAPFDAVEVDRHPPGESHPHVLLPINASAAHSDDLDHSEVARLHQACAGTLIATSSGPSISDSFRAPVS